MKTKYGVIKELECTCSCCPSQWEGVTENNEAVYIRYRWGRLTIELSKPDGTVFDAIRNGELIYSERIGGELDGDISPEEVKRIIVENNLFEIRGEEE